MKLNAMKKLAKTDLVLSGGGSKGIFQAGFLSVMYEHQAVFNRIFGCSVGTLNAVGYGTGNTKKLLELWDKIRFGETQFFTKGILGIGWILRAIGGGDGIYSNKPLYKLVEENFGLMDHDKFGAVYFDVVDLLLITLR
jgi:predicted acylesterase/phospholipase RssA